VTLLPAENIHHLISVGIAPRNVCPPGRLGLVATIVVLIPEVLTTLVLAILRGQLLLKLLGLICRIGGDSLDSTFFVLSLHNLDLGCGFRLLLRARFNGSQPDCCVQVQRGHRLQVDDSAKVHQKGSPEVIQEVELSQILVSCCIVSPHFGHIDFAIAIRNWLWWHDCVALV
jgi:hypothetical protein